jgi:hypothetical protein
MDMTPKDELSQVVFIHDYLQLVFQDVYFTLLTPPILTSDGERFRPGERGFCDELVSLISSKATAVERGANDDLSISFANGAKVSVLTSDPRATGPEAWHFGGAGLPGFVAVTR